MPNSLDTAWAQMLMDETGLAVFKQGRISFRIYRAKKRNAAEWTGVLLLGQKARAICREVRTSRKCRSPASDMGDHNRAGGGVE